MFYVGKVWAIRIKEETKKTEWMNKSSIPLEFWTLGKRCSSTSTNVAVYSSSSFAIKNSIRLPLPNFGDVWMLKIDFWVRKS